MAEDSHGGGVPGLIAREAIEPRFPKPRCHATTIAETRGGLLVAFYGGPYEGLDHQGIWFSQWDGYGWRPAFPVAEPHDAQSVCWNPVLHQEPAGPLLLFYKEGPSCSDWWGLLLTSEDGGRSWSDPQMLPRGIWGPTRTKPLRLGNGELLCPSSTEHGRWRVHFERTRDLGATWARTDDLAEEERFDPIQPTLLGWHTGRLQALCRSKASRIVETWSGDDGRTWSPLRATSLPNPDSAIDGLVLQDGRALLVYNPQEGSQAGHGGRGRLSVAVSRDGLAWKTLGDLEDGEDGGDEYSYPAVIQTSDGLVHVTYTTGVGWTGMAHVTLDPAGIPT